MLLGSMLAGMAFANAPVAAVHALAYPLGGHFHLPHGLCNSLVLGAGPEFNLPAAQTLYAELGRDAAPALRRQTTLARRRVHRRDPRARRGDAVCADVAAAGVKQDDLPLLAQDAMKVHACW